MSVGKNSSTLQFSVIHLGNNYKLLNDFKIWRNTITSKLAIKLALF
jgi:hypothetical protein